MTGISPFLTSTVSLLQGIISSPEGQKVFAVPSIISGWILFGITSFLSGPSPLIFRDNNHYLLIVITVGVAQIFQVLINITPIKAALNLAEAGDMRRTVCTPMVW
ncbi:hypothetical protein EB796_005711 [Bugula neritina]|uniref:Uncharacterized protein n=1 Tax=Bugula neritina TaxID=10212 RepID=A0A7J7KBG0_BUGNE|nr:hypothetical protein EB796_005711 [Bugula neritina]